MKKENFCFLAGAILCLIFMFLTAALIELDRLFPFINSDSLFFQVLYQDLLVDKNPLRGWDLNTTFNLLPNAILYLVAFLVSKNPYINTLIHGLLQYSLFMIALFWLYRNIRPNATMYWHIPGLMLISLFFVDAIVINDFYIHSLFIHPYHFGAFILFFILSALSFSYLENPRRIIAFFILFICALGVFSNLLLTVMFAIPWISVLVFLKIKKQYFSSALLLKSVGLIVSGAILGIALSHWVKGMGIVYFTETNLFSWHNIAPSLRVLFETYHNILRHSTPMKFIAVFSAIGVAFNIFWSFKVVFIDKPKLTESMERRWFNLWMMVSLVFTIGVFFAPAINGIFYDMSAIRYNFFVLILPFVNLGIVTHEFWSKKKASEFVNKRASIASMALFSILFAYIVSQRDIKRLHFEKLDFYPKIAQVIDELSCEFELKNGISLYWTAKLNTVYSRKNIRLVQVFSDLHGYSLASSRSWFAQQRPEDEIPVFNFLVYQDGIEMDRVIEIFGKENIVEIERDGVKIIVLPDFTFEKNLIIRVIENPNP